MKRGDTVQIHDVHHPYYRDEGIIQGIEGERVLIRLNSGEYTTSKQQHLIIISEESMFVDNGPIRISGDGNNSSYYIVHVANPTDEKWEPYFAQCNDLIEALGMTFSEGEAFKAIWRRCRARQGYGKEGNSQRYDAEKVEFFGHRMVVQSND